jgi:choline dehydrogenase-like flavoprotein
VVNPVRRSDPAPKNAGTQPLENLPYGISEGGEIIHELGTVRMGDDPKTSALNKNCQAHDVKNLFVGDGACFVTGPDKNPTLTITALSWRTSEYILDQSKKGEI